MVRPNFNKPKNASNAIQKNLGVSRIRVCPKKRLPLSSLEVHVIWNRREVRGELNKQSKHVCD